MTTISFSSGDFPEKQRKAALEEKYARIFGMDIQGTGPSSSVEMRGSILVDSALVEIQASPHIARRTNAHISSSNEDWALILPTKGRGAITNRSAHTKQEEEICEPGDAYLVTGDDPFDTVNDRDFSLLVISLPGKTFEPRLAQPGAVLMQKVRPQAVDNLRLLVNFVRMMLNQDAGLSETGARLSSLYIHDLAVLLLNTNQEETWLARNRGLAAVRLRAIKAFIGQHCRRPDISLGMIAAQHNISEHYVRKLLYDAGTSFSDCLVEARLGTVYRQLRHPLYLHKHISELAYAAGFNNLSWFNRAFKRRYGKTPSDMRRRT